MTLDEENGILATLSELHTPKQSQKTETDTKSISMLLIDSEKMVRAHKEWDYTIETKQSKTYSSKSNSKP